MSQREVITEAGIYPTETAAQAVVDQAEWLQPRTPYERIYPWYEPNYGGYVIVRETNIAPNRPLYMGSPQFAWAAPTQTTILNGDLTPEYITIDTSPQLYIDPDMAITADEMPNEPLISRPALEPVVIDDDSDDDVMVVDEKGPRPNFKPAHGKSEDLITLFCRFLKQEGIPYTESTRREAITRFVMEVADMIAPGDFFREIHNDKNGSVALTVKKGYIMPIRNIARNWGFVVYNPDHPEI